MMDGKATTSQSLLTKKSLALSLAAPRVPPHGTAHRALLLGGDPSFLPWARHHHHDEANATTAPIKKRQRHHDSSTTLHKINLHHHHISLHRQLASFLQQSSIALRNNPLLPHPHLPSSGPDLADQITRALGVWCPLSWQNWLRDSGHLRTVVDNLLLYSAPAYLYLACHPQVRHEFQHLTKLCKTIRYGNHPSQIIDMFLPEDDENDSDTTSAPKTPRGLVFFVHGGAWGSGCPLLYRLVASPFLKQNIAVAIVGYRTYPCGNVATQIEDLELASEELAQRYPQLCSQAANTEFGVCLMGHSSGANVAFLLVAEWTRQRMELLERTHKKRGHRDVDASTTEYNQQQPATASIPKQMLGPGMRIDSFVGISGPYNISNHFDYEASRGLEEISPMKPACGYSREEFRKHSPALKIVDCMSAWSAECEKRALDNIIPSMMLIHGMEDDVVPFTSTAEAASLLRSCGVTKLDEVYLARTAHNECALQLMMGGETQDIVLDWIQNSQVKQQQQQHPNRARRKMVVKSRL